MNGHDTRNSYRVDVNGNTYHVTFEENGRVRFDELELTLDVTENETRDHFSLLIDNESFLLGVEPGEELSLFKAHAGGYDFDIEVLGAREAYLREYLRAAGVGKKEGQVKATMPGLIRKLEVEQGDEVEAGQGVLIMEAMKMENEISSPIAGVVDAIHVAEGDAVEKGARLFDIRNPEDG